MSFGGCNINYVYEYPQLALPTLKESLFFLITQTGYFMLLLERKNVRWLSGRLAVALWFINCSLTKNCIFMNHGVDCLTQHTIKHHVPLIRHHVQPRIG